MTTAASALDLNEDELQTLQTKQVTVGNVSVWIAELTYDQGSAQIKAGQELAKREDVPNEDWENHVASALVMSFNMIAQKDGKQPLWTIEKVRKRFGRGTGNVIYRELLTLSGLRLPEEGSARAGEAKAA